MLSGCAHRGIVNAVKQAQAMTGIERVHAVIGGFHLTGARPDVIQRTIAAFASEMPDQFILNTAGTRYIL